MSGGRTGWRPHIEGALRIDLCRMMRERFIVAGVIRCGTWHWSRDGERIGSIDYFARLNETEGTLTLSYQWRNPGTGETQRCDYPIKIQSAPCTFGGRRWWMICPYTGRRALKLYKFGGIEKFCCRRAIRPLPSYLSERLSGESRIDHQRWTLRRKLDDPGCLFDPLTKPKWMRQRTFERFERRDDELSERHVPYISRTVGRILSRG